MEDPRKTILVVDDDPVSRRVLRERLSSSGFQVVEAGGASQGIALAGKIRPDLILLDVMMPGQDGIQVFHALRQEPSTRETPIILLTALSESVEPLVSGDPRRDYWMLGKPYKSEELLSAVQRALQASLKKD